MTVIFIDKAGSSVGTRGEQVVINLKDEPPRFLPVTQIERVVITGRGVQLSTPALLLFASRAIDVTFLRRSGVMAARFSAPGRRDVLIRVAQVAFVSDPERRLELARALVIGKLANQAGLLERRGQVGPARMIRETARRAQDAGNLDALRGHEGSGARAYFQSWGALLPGEFGFRGRRYHPAPDPINSALSLLYTCLMQDAMRACTAAGLDVDLGVLHEAGPSKPALALDIMEEFRPLTADSIVLQAANNGWIATDARMSSVRLTDRTRRLLLEAYERRMAVKRVSSNGTRLTYRGCLMEQARQIELLTTGKRGRYESLGWR